MLTKVTMKRHKLKVAIKNSLTEKITVNVNIKLDKYTNEEKITVNILVESFNKKIQQKNPSIL